MKLVVAGPDALPGKLSWGPGAPTGVGGPRVPPKEMKLEAKSSEVRTGAIAPLLAGDFFVCFQIIFGLIFDQNGNFSLFFAMFPYFLSFLIGFSFFYHILDNRINWSEVETFTLK